MDCQRCGKDAGKGCPFCRHCGSRLDSALVETIRWTASAASESSDSESLLSWAWNHEKTIKIPMAKGGSGWIVCGHLVIVRNDRNFPKKNHSKRCQILDFDQHHRAVPWHLSPGKRIQLPTWPVQMVYVTLLSISQCFTPSIWLHAIESTNWWAHGPALRLQGTPPGKLPAVSAKFRCSSTCPGENQMRGS